MTEPNKITIPWGEGELALALPDQWHVTGILEPQSLPAVADVSAEVRRALAQPIGLPPLPKLMETFPGGKIALVVDDGSRPTPVARILPVVLQELQEAGVQRSQITLIPAIGLHRPMTENEIEQRIGRACLEGLKCENHDCDDLSRLEYMGLTTRGTPVYINKTVAQADVIISIGCIEPHIIASFGGGYKNLVPGVAGRATVAHNHSLNCTPATFNMVGQPIESNPMRLDLEEAAGRLKPPVFIINAVLNSTLQAVRVVAGNPIAAHREGVRISAALYGVHVGQPADVVITASHPMDQDLRQGVKALANTIRAVRRGGAHITLVRAEEGVGVFGLANRKLPLGRRGLLAVAPVLLPLVPRLKLKGMGEEDRFFLYFALQAMRHATLLMYAPTIPAGVKANLPFVQFVTSASDTVSAAHQCITGHAEVLVFPHGGITYPAFL
ncbi:MAG TPA: nickel-dependent lactate racemase [Anaerolineae bacterium]